MKKEKPYEVTVSTEEVSNTDELEESESSEEEKDEDEDEEDEEDAQSEGNDWDNGFEDDESEVFRSEAT